MGLQSIFFSRCGLHLKIQLNVILHLCWSLVSKCVSTLIKNHIHTSLIADEINLAKEPLSWQTDFFLSSSCHDLKSLHLLLQPFNDSKSDVRKPIQIKTQVKETKAEREDIQYSHYTPLLISSVYLLYTRLLIMSQGKTRAKAAEI